MWQRLIKKGRTEKGSIRKKREKKIEKGNGEVDYRGEEKRTGKWKEQEGKNE